MSAIRFRFIRATSALRLLRIPLKGEAIYDTDTLNLFIGDGTTLGGRPINLASVVSAATDIDLTVTTENFIRVFGSTPITITLPSISSDKIIIKNTSTQVCTIIAPSGLVNGVTSIQLDPLQNGGFAEGNLGQSVTLYFQGGQFWVT